MFGIWLWRDKVTLQKKEREKIMDTKGKKLQEKALKC